MVKPHSYTSKRNSGIFHERQQGYDYRTGR
jgi:hypothetical protein